MYNDNKRFLDILLDSLPQDANCDFLFVCQTFFALEFHESHLHTFARDCTTMPTVWSRKNKEKPYKNSQDDKILFDDNCLYS